MVIHVLMLDPKKLSSLAKGSCAVGQTLLSGQHRQGCQCHLLAFMKVLRETFHIQPQQSVFRMIRASGLLLESSGFI